MICGLLICAAFTFGWWFGGWQVYRNWKKLAALSAKSLACADFWQKEFLNLLGDQALSRAGLANRNVDEEEYLRHTAHVVSNLPQPLSDSDRMWMNGYKQGWIAGWQTLSYSTPASPPKPTSAIDSAKR